VLLGTLGARSLRIVPRISAKLFITETKVFKAGSAPVTKLDKMVKPSGHHTVGTVPVVRERVGEVTERLACASLLKAAEQSLWSLRPQEFISSTMRLHILVARCFKYACATLVWDVCWLSLEATWI
jgi:hypothetical protein